MTLLQWAFLKNGVRKLCGQHKVFPSKRVPYSHAHVPVKMVPADIVLDENTIAWTGI